LATQVDFWASRLAERSVAGVLPSVFATCKLSFVLQHVETTCARMHTVVNAKSQIFSLKNGDMHLIAQA